MCGWSAGRLQRDRVVSRRAGPRASHDRFVCLHGLSDYDVRGILDSAVMLKSRYWIRALGLVLLAALAAGGGLTRRYREERCALDGQRIQPIFRVRIARRGEPPHSFCCIRCAEIWRARGGSVGVISVTDEVTGRELDAE